MKTVDTLVTLLIFSFFLYSCSDSKKSVQETEQSMTENMIYKADYGENWPFTVDKGILKCVSQGVVFIANGKTYAVNGTALNFKTEYGYSEMDEVWAYDTIMMKQLIAAGFSKEEAEKHKIRISVDKIIKDGLKLCGQ